MPYYNAKDAQAGVTLRLKACQVIELATGGDSNGESYGFGAEEGYDADDEPMRDDEGFEEEEGGYDDSEEDDNDDGESHGDF